MREQEDLLLVGKLDGREAVAAVSCGPKGRLALLVDESSQQRFRVDTGSSYSILPHKSKQPTSGPRLCTADRSPIACWGDRRLHVAAGGRRFTWTFLLADVAMTIIGADFLRHFGLLVDLGEMQLLARGGGWSQHLVEPSGSGTFATIGVIADKQPTTPSLPTVEARGSSPTLQDVEPTTPSLPTVEACGSSSPLQHLLEDFPSVLNKSKVLLAPTHRVQHFLITEGRPVTAKYRRLDNERLEAAKKEFAEVEKQGIIRRSSSNWASPLHMVKKADVTWRPCGDYRQLNLQTKPDLYTCPNIADLTARLEGCTIFSKLDLRKGFHQIPVRPCDVPKTAVITPFGLWEFIRMSFGLRNAGQSFQ